LAEFELVEERVISGKGSLRIPPGESPYRYVVVYADVIRMPKNAYLNFAYNPPLSRYATLNFLRKGYLIESKPLGYSSQSFDFIGDPAGQALLAIKCAYDGILQSFVNLATGIGGTPGGIGMAVINVVDLIARYENLDLVWDEIKVVCYADTLVQLRAYKLEYDTCDPENNKGFKPPKPPSKRPMIPPGTPYPDVSPPYEPDPERPPQQDEDGDEPFPGDEPGSGTGLGWFRLDWTFVDGAGNTQNGAGITKGRFGDIFDFVPGNRPDCFNGTGTDLVINGQLAIETFACAVPVSNLQTNYLAQNPAPGSELPNLVYP
jgi:hypothetical protein